METLIQSQLDFRTRLEEMIDDECHPRGGGTPYFGEDMDYEQRLENYLSENIKDICDQCGVTPDQDYFSFSDKQLLDAFNIIDGGC
tara:strand:+ start:255 stop:512 length:258 start_codon:yes stop_codon:yes gene_type:complete